MYDACLVASHPPAECVCCQELEKKRKSSGKEDVKLTKKQQEAVTAQLAKESMKRATLRQVLLLDDIFTLLKPWLCVT